MIWTQIHFTLPYQRYFQARSWPAWHKKMQYLKRWEIVSTTGTRTAAVKLAHTTQILEGLSCEKWRCMCGWSNCHPQLLQGRVCWSNPGDTSRELGMTDMAVHAWWPFMHRDLLSKTAQCNPCIKIGKNLKSIIPYSKWAPQTVKYQMKKFKKTSVDQHLMRKIKSLFSCMYRPFL